MRQDPRRRRPGRVNAARRRLRGARRRRRPRGRQTLGRSLVRPLSRPTRTAGGVCSCPRPTPSGTAGFTYAHGLLEFNLYDCAGGVLRASDPADRASSTYLLGIGEVPSSWPRRGAAHPGRRRTHLRLVLDHALRAALELQLPHHRTARATRPTSGMARRVGAAGKRWVGRRQRHERARVVTYKGSLIQAFFAASDGGHSENVEDVWHGGNPAYAVPYLSGVCDPGEYTSANPWTDWRYSFGARRAHQPARRPTRGASAA